MTALSPALATAAALDVAPALDLDQLTLLVRGLADEERLWAPRVRFGSGSRRWWTRLHGDPRVDVWLLTWLPGHSTDLHDHGSSAAAFTVVRGRLDDVRVADGRLTATSHSPGAVTWLAPGVVHDVRSGSAEPAVSIHAYSPPLREMTYYALDRGALTPVRSVTTDEPEEADG